MTPDPTSPDDSRDQPRALFLVSDDLMIVSSVQAACLRQGWSFAASGRKSLDPRAAAAAAIVVVDLGAPWEPEQLRALVEASSGAVAGFGPHVQTERLAAARAAGLRPVLARGSFLSGLDEFLSAAATARGD